MPQGLFLHYYAVSDSEALLSVSNNSDGDDIEPMGIALETSWPRNGYPLWIVPYELVSQWAYRIGADSEGVFRGMVRSGRKYDATVSAFELASEPIDQFATVVPFEAGMDFFPATLLDLRLCCRPELAIQFVRVGRGIDVTFKATREYEKWVLQGDLTLAAQFLSPVLESLSMSLVLGSRYLEEFARDCSPDAFGC